MVLAGGVNVAMLLLAAAVLKGHSSADSLGIIFHSLGSLIAPLVAWLFALGLLVSGFASTAVGTQAGDVIMHGLLRKRISPLLRRMIVIIPSIVLLAVGADPTQSLIVSQIALSFGIPFALVPLALVSSSRRIMGDARNTLLMTWTIYAIAGVVSLLNVALIWLTI